MAQLKIYSAAPNGNEAADTQDALYMNLAINKLNEESARLKTAEQPVQIMLVHLDILLHLAKKFPKGAHLSIKAANAKEWKDTFYDWYQRCQGKIPAKFRDGIKQSADDLFSELEQIAS